METVRGIGKNLPKKKSSIKGLLPSLMRDGGSYVSYMLKELPSNRKKK